MPSVDRQNKLIAAEDWTRVYQSFKNADFQSYDFDNLRRTMITYLRENYPEDFNDYIESSEYLALIDLIAFLGQNLAFRFDLNARDNFLELAERRESVLRLARLLSYNVKRNQPSSGLLKITSVKTTENVLDSNGRDLANQTIVWNDSANTNWYEQFIKVLNSSLPETAQYGKPQDSATINGVPTSQYRFNALNTEVPVYGFTKTVDGRNMDFEVVSASFKNSQMVFEESPFPGRSLAFLYRDDGGGPASSNTGFFTFFKQGTLQEAAFTISNPAPNEVVDVDSQNINNTDVWLYDLTTAGREKSLWTKVDAVEGNNIIYNSVSKNVRNIYSVLTRTADRARLIFSDGVFGNLPNGNFKLYYRTSNGLTYNIVPNALRNISVDIPYQSRSGRQEIITLGLSLKYTVSNALGAESSADIKANAPATYYTQGRMITGEDYNILPLTSNQEIIKAKAINRVSSGISRYFDLKDVTGKYSTTNLFGTDGILYKETIVDRFNFSSTTRNDIASVILNKVEPILAKTTVKDFYIDNFPSISLEPANSSLVQVTAGTNSTTGYIVDVVTNEIKKVSSYSSSNLRFFNPGALVKFVPPSGKKFFKGELVDAGSAPDSATDYIWSKVIKVTGDGTAVSNAGLGPIVFNEVIPTGALMLALYPKFVTSLDTAVKTKMIDLIFGNKTFALRYDKENTIWKIVSDANIDRVNKFSLGKTGDTSNQQLDASWLVLFETNGETYTVSYRATRYVFESQKEIRFFFDASDKVYDSASGKSIKDSITVLDINPQPDSASAIGRNLIWEISDDYIGSDGYIDSKKISVTFADTDEDGVVDDPDLFKNIVAPSVNQTTKFIFQQLQTSTNGITDYYYIDNSDDTILVYQTQSDIDKSQPEFAVERLVYLIDENVIKTAYPGLPDLVINNNYRAFPGRSKIKFQYIHAADESARIDPSATNIIDVYMLTKNYDTQYRRWAKGDLSTKPLPPSSDALYVNFGTELNKIKAISDEIIYHPVRYKELFGSSAPSSLQATFKVVKSPSVLVSDSEIKVSIITAINEFFAIDNWDFGDTFYFTELSTYITNKLSPNVANLLIVPKQSNLSFGSLYEIKANSDEILFSTATVDDVEIISELTASRIRSGQIITSTTPNTGITSN